MGLSMQSPAQPQLCPLLPSERPQVLYGADIPHPSQQGRAAAGVR